MHSREHLSNMYINWSIEDQAQRAESAYLLHNIIRLTKMVGHMYMNWTNAGKKYGFRKTSTGPYRSCAGLLDILNPLRIFWGIFVWLGLFHFVWSSLVRFGWIGVLYFLKICIDICLTLCVSNICNNASYLHSLMRVFPHMNYYNRQEETWSIWLCTGTGLYRSCANLALALDF